MAEGGDVDLGAELSIYPCEQVQIEGRGEALAVIIGRDEAVSVFIDIDAEQELTLWPDMLTHQPHEGDNLVIVKIAER